MVSTLLNENIRDILTNYLIEKIKQYSDRHPIRVEIKNHLETGMD